MTQSIIVAAIVVLAVAWAIWTIIKRGARGGCASCGSGSSCPYASKGACPSEGVEEPEICDEIREEQSEAALDEGRTPEQ
ncbi:MAG: FeoB-associated Cys-rich membrane protein [Armatimonadota bacterium]